MTENVPVIGKNELSKQYNIEYVVWYCGSEAKMLKYSLQQTPPVSSQFSFYVECVDHAHNVFAVSTLLACSVFTIPEFPLPSYFEGY